jgi:hypothetical protein
MIMPTPSLSAEQIRQVSESVAQYIAGQRNHFFPRASHLTSAQKAAMAAFFRPDVLETTRLLVLEKERIANPDFYAGLWTLGFSNLPDFELMAAVTFQNVVVSHEPFSDGLLFHELVHVEQYRQLGVPRFAELYVRGFLAGGGYYGIPLEMNAYALGDRFESDPHRTFSVESEVLSWINAGRF